MKYLFYSDEEIEEPVVKNCVDDAFASSDYIDSMLKAVEKSLTRSLARQVVDN